MAIVSRVLKRKKLPLFDRTTVSPFSIHNVDKHRALEVIHLWILHAANGTINWRVRENKKRLKSELDYWLAINNNVRMRMSKRTIVHFISPVFLCAVSSFFVPLSFWNIWSNKARVSNVHVCLTSSTFEIGAHLFVLRGIICTDLDHFLVYFHRFGPSNHYSCGLLPLYCCFYLLFFSPFSFSFFFLFGSKCFSTNILTVEITFIIYHHMKLIIVVVVAFFHSCTNHTSRIFIFRFVEIATSIANNALKHCRSSHGNSTINIIYGTFWKLFFIFVGQTVVLWIFSSN